MNPCKEISAHSVHRQLDGIAEQVAAELQQYHSEGGEQEAKSSPASDDSKVDPSRSSTCVKEAKSSPARDDSKVDPSRSSTCAKVGDSTKDHDRVNTKAAGCERVSLGELQLPTEVVLDGINTVLYGRLCFSAPSMEQYYNLENSFIDKVRLRLQCHEMLSRQNDCCFLRYFLGILIFRY